MLLVTNSIEESSSWEAKRSLASQEIPRIFWNPKVHYSIHNRLPLRPVLTLSLAIACVVPGDSLQSPMPCEVFRNIVSLYSEEMLAPLPTP
jgi:hypothetical protein